MMMMMIIIIITTIDSTPHKIFLGRDGRGIWHVWERQKVRSGFWWGNLKE